MVGRGAEPRQLGALLARADEGAGSVVLVSGEAGIGKTRLCLELFRSCRRRGGHALLGRAVPEESGLPYAALADALRAARRAEPAVWDAAGARGHPPGHACRRAAAARPPRRGGRGRSRQPKLPASAAADSSRRRSPRHGSGTSRYQRGHWPPKRPRRQRHGRGWVRWWDAGAGSSCGTLMLPRLPANGSRHSARRSAAWA